MTEFTWSNKKSWPDDIDSHVFLASAIEQIARLLQPDWSVADIAVEDLGPEPTLPPPLPNALENATSKDLIAAIKLFPIKTSPLATYDQFTEEHSGGGETKQTVRLLRSRYANPGMAKEVEINRKAAHAQWHHAKEADRKVRDAFPGQLEEYNKRAAARDRTEQLFRKVAALFRQGDLVSALRDTKGGDIGWPENKSLWYCELPVFDRRFRTCQINQLNKFEALPSTEYKYITPPTWMTYVWVSRDSLDKFLATCGQTKDAPSGKMSNAFRGSFLRPRFETMKRERNWEEWPFTREKFREECARLMRLKVEDIGETFADDLRKKIFGPGKPGARAKSRKTA